MFLFLFFSFLFLSSLGWPRYRCDTARFSVCFAVGAAVSHVTCGKRAASISLRRCVNSHSTKARRNEIYSVASVYFPQDTRVGFMKMRNSIIWRTGSVRRGISYRATPAVSSQKSCCLFSLPCRVCWTKPTDSGTGRAEHQTGRRNRCQSDPQIKSCECKPDDWRCADVPQLSASQVDVTTTGCGCSCALRVDAPENRRSNAGRRAHGRWSVYRFRRQRWLDGSCFGFLRFIATRPDSNLTLNPTSTLTPTSTPRPSVRVRWSGRNGCLRQEGMFRELLPETRFV